MTQPAVTPAAPATPIVSLPIIEQVKRVAQARAGAAVFAAELAAKQRAFDDENARLIQLAAQARVTAAAEEQALRDFAVRHYRETQEKHPAPGVSIRLAKSVEYDPETAFGWAKVNGLALKLDVKAFEKIALATPLPCAVVNEEPTATIATDLSAVLGTP